MGNCLNSKNRAESARISHNATDPLRATNKSSCAPSNLIAHSTSSTLSVTSCTQGSSGLPTQRIEGEILSSPNLKAFTFNELRNATRNFRLDNLIGKGGFGYVFKGWIDVLTFTASKPGVGKVVAVKKLKPEGFQGHKEWLTEVNYLGQLRHPNLVKLVGFCSDGDNRLLVYEYMPKGSLENHLFRRGAQPLSWDTRIKVAIGAARGLAFLHNAERQVIYRDVKASNILLDSDFHPKLSDFGLAKAGPTGNMTHVTTRVIGTQGYAAPEYIATGRLSSKADVYSFGVVLLELLSGRCAYDKSKAGLDQNLVSWARPCLSDKRKLFRIMDSKLEGQYPKKGAHALANIALQCIGNEAKLRPSMTMVLSALERLQVLKSGKIHQAERTNSSRPGKKSLIRHNASPRPTPSVSPLRQTPSASTLRQIPGGSPLRQAPGRSPLRNNPGASPNRPASGGSPVPSNWLAPLAR